MEIVGEDGCAALAERDNADRCRHRTWPEEGSPAGVARESSIVGAVGLEFVVEFELAMWAGSLLLDDLSCAQDWLLDLARSRTKGLLRLVEQLLKILMGTMSAFAPDHMWLLRLHLVTTLILSK